MAKLSGHGAFIVFDSTANTRVENAQFDIETEEVIDDVTDSGSGGVAQGLPILSKVTSVVIEAIDDDSVAFAETIGLTEGAVVTLWFKRGTLATGHLVTGTIVRNVHVRNPQNAARRVTISTEYGFLTRAAVQPVIP